MSNEKPAAGASQHHFRHYRMPEDARSCTRFRQILRQLRRKFRWSPRDRTHISAVVRASHQSPDALSRQLDRPIRSPRLGPGNPALERRAAYPGSGAAGAHSTPRSGYLEPLPEAVVHTMILGISARHHRAITHRLRAVFVVVEK